MFVVKSDIFKCIMLSVVDDSKCSCYLQVILYKTEVFPTIEVIHYMRVNIIRTRISFFDSDFNELRNCLLEFHR